MDQQGKGTTSNQAHWIVRKCYDFNFLCQSKAYGVVDEIQGFACVNRQRVGNKVR